VAIRQCLNHHFYDDEKYEVCPICLLKEQHPETMEDATIGYAVPTDLAADKTIGYQMVLEDVIAKPTVGWVVCTKGNERGRDWRLHEGRNDVGTTPDAEVSLAEAGLQEPCMCSIIYDGKHKEFMVAPGNFPLIYLNGKLLSSPLPLGDGDEISVGENLLCFQSFCGKYW